MITTSGINSIYASLRSILANCGSIAATTLSARRRGSSLAVGLLAVFLAPWAFGGATITFTPITPVVAAPPAQPAFSILIQTDSSEDGNGNTEFDTLTEFTLSAAGYSSWNYYSLWGEGPAAYSSNWSDPRGPLGAGTYSYTLVARGYRKVSYNNGWIDGQYVDEHDDPDDPDAVTGSHWEDGHWDTGFNWNWEQLGSASISFTVASATAQTISFTNPGSKTFGDAFIPGATASSGLPVSYSVVSGPATVSGNTVSITGVGTVVLQASQAGGLSGNTYYSAAAAVQHSFSTNKLAQLLTFPPQTTRGFGAHPLASLGISMSPNALPAVVTVDSGPATVTGGFLNITSTSGTVTLTASQPGGANHLPSNSITQSFGVAKGTQIITAPLTPALSVTQAPYIAAATVNSGLPLLYEVVSGSANINPATGVLTVGGAPGIVSIRASQSSGSASWDPAAPVLYSYNVTAPAGWVGASIPVLGTVSYSTAAQPFPALTFSTNRLPIGTFSATLRTAAGAIISGPVQAIPQSPTTPVTYQGGSGAINGLIGSYYHGANFSSLGYTVTDAQINFDWGDDGPGVGQEDSGGGYWEDEHDNPEDPDEVTGSHWVDGYTHWDLFSVRWTGYVQAPSTENVTFITTSDDGVRLWVNGALVINDWNDHGMTDRMSSPIPMVQGQSYPITLEYFENWGRAAVQLSWSSPTRSREIIPTQRIFAAQPITTINSSFVWSIGGLAIPAGQAAAEGYRLHLAYTPFDTQTVASSAISLFAIQAEPPPTMLKYSGDGQTGLTGQYNSLSFDVAVYSSHETPPSPWVSKPVTFSVRSGGGLLAASNSGGATLQSSITLSTDAVGTAEVFYRQPAVAGVLSEIVARSGGAEVVFSTLSATEVNPSAPANLQATGGSHVSLSWSPSSAANGGSSVVGYHVYRNGARLNANPVAGTSYSDTTAAPGGSYAYSVRAVDQQQNLSQASFIFVGTSGALVQLRLAPASTVLSVNTGTWSP